ncbi:50S ribosomal protein L13 [Candidatus Woesearchaeota archaeon]|nr:50S ribosomal protein L13 [Candidatus Woesearchaeota archaeon]
MIIDATDLIAGRVATVAAKTALLGEKVDIVNCEKGVIAGKKDYILHAYRNKMHRGTFKGPYLPRRPDLFYKRLIRGMLPYKKQRGGQAFDRIRCHIGVPENLKDQKADTIETANVQKLPNLNYLTIRDICKFLGARI